MGKKRKIISLIVSVAMLVAMLPMIVHADGEPTPGSFAALQAIIDSGTSYYALDTDYTALPDDDCIVVNHTIVIDFNGHSLNRSLNEATDNGHVIKVVAGGQLILMNTDSNVPSIIRGGYAENGGGIYVEAQGKLRFDYGMIIVTGNNATNYGGGIYNAGSATLNDCTISTNTAGVHGSGVYLASNSTLNLVGSPVVTGNTSDNLFFAKDSLIDFPSDMQGMSGAFAKVSAADEDLPMVITSGYGAKMQNANPSSYFQAPDGYEVVLENNEVVLQPTGGQQIDTPVKIKTCNVTLGGTLGVNVYVDYGNLDAATKAASTMTISIDGKGGKQQEYTFDDAVERDIGGTTYYGYTFDISSIQMADKITATVSYEGHDPIVAEFSVEDYLVALDENWQEYGYDYAEKDIVRMIANYGYYIQRYLDFINDGWSVANGDHAEFTTRYNPMAPTAQNIYNMVLSATKDTDRVKYSPTKVVDENSTITKMTYSLEFGTTIALEVFFTVEPGTDFSASAYCEYTGKTYRAYLADDGRYKIRVSGISVQDLDNMFISISGTAGSEFTVDVHPFGYIYNAVSTTAETQKALLKKDAMTALYLFYYQIEQPQI